MNYVIIGRSLRMHYHQIAVDGGVYGLGYANGHVGIGAGEGTHILIRSIQLAVSVTHIPVQGHAADIAVGSRIVCAIG